MVFDLPLEMYTTSHKREFQPVQGKYSIRTNSSASILERKNAPLRPSTTEFAARRPFKERRQKIFENLFFIFLIFQFLLTSTICGWCSPINNKCRIPLSEAVRCKRANPLWNCIRSTQQQASSRVNKPIFLQLIIFNLKSNVYWSPPEASRRRKRQRRAIRGT